MNYFFENIEILTFDENLMKQMLNFFRSEKISKKYGNLLILPVYNCEFF